MKTKLLFLAATMVASLQLSAQNVVLKGIGHDNRYDDGEQMPSTYVGYNASVQKSIFVVDQGIYSMKWDGSALSAPVKDPAVNIADFYSAGQFTDNSKALWNIEIVDSPKAEMTIEERADFFKSEMFKKTAKKAYYRISAAFETFNKNVKPLC